MKTPTTLQTPKALNTCPGRTTHSPWRVGRVAVGCVVLASLAACSLLSPTVTPATAYFSLDAGVSAAGGRVNARTGTPMASPAGSPITSGVNASRTLIISPTRAAAGYDSHRIIYVREPHKLAYFANSEWVDPPARLLGPLLVTAGERSGAFQAVMSSAGGAVGDVRLDTEIVRLQHEFLTRPSQVRFTLRVTLVQEKSRRVLAWRELEAVTPASSDDPYAGVVAANQSVQAVLTDLSQFLSKEQP